MPADIIASWECIQSPSFKNIPIALAKFSNILLISINSVIFVQFHVCLMMPVNSEKLWNQSIELDLNE